MARRGYAPREIDDYSSQKVFLLRKEQKLSEAYSLAISLYNEDPNDEWIQKAYAWVLIDIVKIEINSDLNKAKSFFNQLQSINFLDKDKILTKQIEFLKPKLNINYSEILQADNYSKNGHHELAISSFRQLKEQGKLANDNHDSYGWAIYRHLKDNQDTLNINDVKKLLFEYLQLNNPRPELLHSMILQFAMSYSNKYSNLDIYKFFKMWNPKYLRSEDKKKQYKDNKSYPSLVEKLIRLFVEKNYQLDIGYLQEVIADDLLVIDTIRETFFWKLFNLHKDNKLQELWNMFDFYVNNFSNLGSSHWHSEILKLANKFMIEDNAWRFFNFFQNWGYVNLSNEDWQEETNGEHIYKPLARKSLSLINKNIKSNNINADNLTWVVELYVVALEKFENDTWLLREYATLLNNVNRNQDAIDIYKSIILDLSDQAYVWHEFSGLLENVDVNIALSMLCKAMSIQKNKDFLDQIHLDLARLLVGKNKLIEAKTELKQYEEHRKEKGWKLAEEFVLLNNQLQDTEAQEDNFEFYKNNIELSDEYIYSDIKWTDLLFFDKWKTKEQKEIAVFSDLKDIELAVNLRKFKILQNAKVDEIYQFKLHYDKTKERYIALKVQKSTLLKKDLIDNASVDIAIVDHINKEKKLFHYVVNSSSDGVIRFNQTELQPNIGDFIKIKYFKTFDNKQHKYKINILEVELTDEINTLLYKEIEGTLSLKVKYQDNYDSEHDVADFGFISDYYVPKYLLEKYKIREDCIVKAKVIRNGSKWRVFKLII